MIWGVRPDDLTKYNSSRMDSGGIRVTLKTVICVQPRIREAVPFVCFNFYWYEIHHSKMSNFAPSMHVVNFFIIYDFRLKFILLRERWSAAVVWMHMALLLCHMPNSRLRTRNVPLTIDTGLFEKASSVYLPKKIEMLDWMRVNTSTTRKLRQTNIQDDLWTLYCTVIMQLEFNSDRMHQLIVLLLVLLKFNTREVGRAVQMRIRRRSEYHEEHNSLCFIVMQGSKLLLYISNWNSCHEWSA
jgi:hypothetical protein